MEELRRALAQEQLEVVTGEGTGRAGISLAVKERIKTCDLLIAIFTRDAQSAPPDHAAGAGPRYPTRPWVIAEAAFAHAHGIPVVLLVESGVDKGGLFGDVEHLEFNGDGQGQSQFKEKVAHAVGQAVSVREEVAGDEASPSNYRAWKKGQGRAWLLGGVLLVACLIVATRACASVIRDVAVSPHPGQTLLKLLAAQTAPPAPTPTVTAPLLHFLHVVVLLGLTLVLLLQYRQLLLNSDGNPRFTPPPAPESSRNDPALLGRLRVLSGAIFTWFFPEPAPRYYRGLSNHVRMRTTRVMRGVFVAFLMMLLFYTCRLAQDAFAPDEATEVALRFGNSFAHAAVVAALFSVYLHLEQESCKLRSQALTRRVLMAVFVVAVGTWTAFGKQPGPGASVAQIANWAFWYAPLAFCFSFAVTLLACRIASRYMCAPWPLTVLLIAYAGLQWASPWALAYDPAVIPWYVLAVIGKIALFLAFEHLFLTGKLAFYLVNIDRVQRASAGEFQDWQDGAGLERGPAPAGITDRGPTTPDSRPAT
jgi:hypothetical protein